MSKITLYTGNLNDFYTKNETRKTPLTTWKTLKKNIFL